MSEPISDVERAKRSAAFAAVDNHLKNGLKVGIGNGSTIEYAVQRIKQKGLDVKCCPICIESKILLREYGLPLTDLEETPELDVTIEGADEIDVNTKNAIIGGCGAQTQFKIVSSVSKKVIIIVDFTKRSQNLGQIRKIGAPIEVIPMAYKCVSNQIEKWFGGKAVLRMAKAKAGPVITDNNNFIIDWIFDDKDIKDWNYINTKIKSISGVVETGILTDLDIDLTIYLGREDGSAQRL